MLQASRVATVRRRKLFIGRNKLLVGEHAPLMHIDFCNVFRCAQLFADHIESNFEEFVNILFFNSYKTSSTEYKNS